MANVINIDLLKDLFTTFPTLNTIWFKGNLNTFSRTEVVIDDDSVIGDVIYFFGVTHNSFDVTCGLTVYDVDFLRKYGFPINESRGYTECKRGDFV